MSNKRLDLVGERYGLLTVLAPAGLDRHGRTCWVVQCRCGRDKVVSAVSLRQSGCRSCGCLKKEAWARRPTKNIKDGMFTCSRCKQRKPLEEKAGRGNYRCLSCNRAYHLHRSRLPTSIEKQRQWRRANRKRINAKIRENRLRYPDKYLFRTARTRAKKLGVVFTLRQEDIKIPEFCPVLGLRLQKSSSGKGFPDPESPTLDRFDPKGGYTPNNVTVISWRANSLKKDATPEEVEKLANWMRVKHGTR